MGLPPSYLERLNAGPLYRAIGITMERAADGRARSSMAPAEALCWPFPGQPHGGILFTQMDTTMAIAVLAAVERGTSVILCEHTNTERGYLAVFADRLGAALGGRAEVAVARADADPLSVS